MSLGILCAYSLVLAVQSVADVPDPRPAALVVDQAGVVDDAAEGRLNRALVGLREVRGAELAVVTVDDVPGTPKEFATALFNHWKLGTAEKNDGVLVLLVMGQRRLEIETGIGMEAALPAWWLAEMQAATMVPRFKQGSFGDGLEAGVVAMLDRLGALPGEGERDTAPGEYRSDGVISPAAAGTYRAGAGALPPPPPRSAPKDGAPSKAPWIGLGLLGIVGLGGGGWLARRAHRRRKCEKCRVKMLELDEIADDAHLDAGQQKEEQVKSVDYDVLICPGCQGTRVLRNARWFSGRRTCPGCSYKTGKRDSETISAATYDSGGLVRITETCAHCKRNHSYTRSTPRRTRPSTTSSSSGGSRPSYSSSSSSSRSSRSTSSGSSRSSGGSSRGGGAGSSW